MNTSFFRLLATLVFGNGYSVPRELSSREDILIHAGLPRMVAIAGDPGSGKTFFLADHLVTDMKKYPREAQFILDWNGSLTDAIFQIVLSDLKQDELLSRIVYDEIAHPSLVVPLPLFHQDYDPELSWEQRVNAQVARVIQDFEKLNWRLVEENPTLGGIPIRFLLPNFLKLINAISTGSGNSWQITEVRKLLRLPEKEKKEKDKDNEPEKPNELMLALRRYGKKVRRTREYFFEDYFPVSLREKELRTNALRSILNIIEADEIRAKVGFDYYGWSPKEAIEKGQMVIVDGSRLRGREAERNFVFRYIFSLVMTEIKKRRLLSRGAQVKIVLDDASGFFNNEGISVELAEIPINFRTQNLALYLTFQNLGQVLGGMKGKPGLRENLFTIGNFITFAQSDFEDCKTFAEQFISFDPTLVKVPANTETQHAIMNNRDEQIAIRATQIQHFKPRECFVRRYETESRRDPHIRHVRRTRDVVITTTPAEVAVVKEALMRKRGIKISYALQVIGKRKLTKGNAHSDDVDGPVQPSSV